MIYMYRVLKLSVNQHLETNDGKTAVIMSISEKNNADKIVNRDHSKWMLLDRTCIIIKAISSNWLVLILHFDSMHISLIIFKESCVQFCFHIGHILLKDNWRKYKQTNGH